MKRLIAAISLLMVMVLAAGCSQKPSDKFDEKAVVSAAQEAVTLMNEAKYADITSRVREDLRESLSEQVLASAGQQILAGAGAFSEFGKASVSGKTDSSTGEEYAIAVQQAKYAQRTCVYTIVFDTNMNIVGFFLK